MHMYIISVQKLYHGSDFRLWLCAYSVQYDLHVAVCSMSSNISLGADVNSQGVVSYGLAVEACLTGINMESSNQCTF